MIFKKGRVMQNWIYEAPETKVEFVKASEPSPAPFAGALAEAERKRVAELDGVSPRDWGMASEVLWLTRTASELDRLVKIAYAVAKARTEGVETGRALGEAETKRAYGEGYAHGYIARDTVASEKELEKYEHGFNCGRSFEKLNPPEDLGLKTPGLNVPPLMVCMATSSKVDKILPVKITSVNLAMTGNTFPVYALPTDAVPIDCAGQLVGYPSHAVMDAGHTDWNGVSPIDPDKDSASPEPDGYSVTEKEFQEIFDSFKKDVSEKNVFDPKNWGL